MRLKIQLNDESQWFLESVIIDYIDLGLWETYWHVFELPIDCINVLWDGEIKTNFYSKLAEKFGWDFYE